MSFLVLFPFWMSKKSVVDRDRKGYKKNFEIKKEDAEGGYENYYFFMKTLQRFYDTLVEPDTKI